VPRKYINREKTLIRKKDWKQSGYLETVISHQPVSYQLLERAPKSSEDFLTTVVLHREQS
jgi:hypothetical protein